MMKMSTIDHKGAVVVLLCFFHSHLFAQVSVTGIVTDQNSGEPIPGVNVLVNGTTTGTVTDREGSDSVTVPDGSSVLVFSSVGYSTR